MIGFGSETRIYCRALRMFRDVRARAPPVLRSENRRRRRRPRSRGDWRRRLHRLPAVLRIPSAALLGQRMAAAVEPPEDVPRGEHLESAVCGHPALRRAAARRLAAPRSVSRADAGNREDDGPGRLRSRHADGEPAGGRHARPGALRGDLRDACAARPRTPRFSIWFARRRTDTRSRASPPGNSPAASCAAIRCTARPCVEDSCRPAARSSTSDVARD